MIKEFDTRREAHDCFNAIKGGATLRTYGNRHFVFSPSSAAIGHFTTIKAAMAGMDA